jgi:hypothetical protein
MLAALAFDPLSHESPPAPTSALLAATWSTPTIELATQDSSAWGHAGKAATAFVRNR